MTTLVADCPIMLTENALGRIRFLIEGEGNPNAMLRLSVSGGGCSGFQYGMQIDVQKNADDLMYEQEGVRLVVDEMSLELLRGIELDFVEDLSGASFQFRNPNASSTCGCGSSFSV